MKKIFLTGGSGFIGKNIAEHFAGKYQIFAPTHAELELLDEAAVKAYFSQHRVEAVIHSAVRPGHRNAKDPSQILLNNTRMFFNLVRNRALFGKFIFLSSGCVYDQRFYQPKMGESAFDAHVPVDETGLSKYLAAKYLENMAEAVELRIFGVFGKYEDYAIRFISNMICKALFDLPLTIKQNRRFDYIWINDLPPILEYFIENKPQHKAYNVTPDGSIELVELAKIVLEISGKTLPIKVAKAGLGIEYSGDNQLLRREMGSLQFTPIRSAIKQLYDWYASNINSISRDVLLTDK
ncbi:epimerase [candidate division WOR-1 bacterium RIFOXYB2_FULL_48_7]|uniref:Epimerase n=1 Tax=candidate division WOR-1 bacterium RIFOXYB2_FULL_48_7 TaxID=1802583 RepID=A0A1F4TIG0_UNCSA|nr:MAG: epimerase [candidate division WOR-1 bacterium RIFOXYB2_FULL_48_7]